MSKKLSEMTREELWQLFPVELAEHNPDWVNWYKEEVASLKKFLPWGTVYHHIGSTAIADIMAKPIVDILIVVKSLKKMKKVAARMQKRGYIVMSETEKRISLNKGYTENGFAERVFHLHIRLPDDIDEIYFRDYMNDNPNLAFYYESVKLRYAKRYKYNRDAYTEAKGGFVKKYTRAGRSRVIKRPDFKKIKSYDEFMKFFWSIPELREICRSLDLEYLGDRNALFKIIKFYFDGIKIAPKPRPRKYNIEDLTLDTGVIECGFAFGPKFRKFYAQITGNKRFTFNGDMIDVVRTVKRINDTSFTLGDLLDIKLGKKVYEGSCPNSNREWIAFLKAFCADEINQNYHNKCTMATRFWKLLRESDLPKVYSREFIINNKDKI